MSNVGQVDLPTGSVTIQDTLDPHVKYVPGTATYFHQSGQETVTDDSSGTPFPLDGSGITNRAPLPRRGGTHDIVFRVTIDTQDMDNVAVIVNTGTVTAHGMANGMSYNFKAMARIPPEYRAEDLDDGDENECHGEGAEDL